MSAPARYKIKIHKDVTTVDSRHFDAATREKIKRKIRELLSVAPEQSDVLSVEFKVNLLAPAVGDLFVARLPVLQLGGFGA